MLQTVLSGKRMRVKNLMLSACLLNIKFIKQLINRDIV